MRLARAIDRFLEQMRIERDWTPRTLDSYFRVLQKIEDDYPDLRLHDFEGRAGTDLLRRSIAKRWASASPGRRANVISILHSFFGWAEAEGFLDDDPARRIKRPPRRRANVYRPPLPDIALCYAVLEPYERAPWLVMHRLGLRASTVCELRWRDVDLTNGRASVVVKGGHRDKLPIAPDALEKLREVYRELAPTEDDYVFTVEIHRFSGHRRLTYRRDPQHRATPHALLEMVYRVCKRAGVRRFGPHALRHAFATEFLRGSGEDIVSLQELMRHSSIETTRRYTQELRLEELERALARAHGTSVASSDDAEEDELEAARNRRSGPERSRTSDRRRSGSPPERPRADEGDEPPLDHPKGGHKL